MILSVCYVSYIIPPVGCTSLKPVIEKLSGVIDTPASNLTELERHVIHGKNTKRVSLEALAQEERDQVLQTHFKFMILRDPVERMLSAYKDKVGVYAQFGWHLSVPRSKN